MDTAPEQLHQRVVGKPTTAIVAETAMFRRRHRPDTPLGAARLALRTLARRWEDSNNELDELDAELDGLTTVAAPTPRASDGVGAQVATALLAAAGDNPDRLRSSSSFAALCGVSPIDASSGRQQHHRLNRVMRCLERHLIRGVHRASPTTLPLRHSSSRTASELLDIQGSLGAAAFTSTGTAPPVASEWPSRHRAGVVVAGLHR